MFKSKYIFSAIFLTVLVIVSVYGLYRYNENQQHTVDTNEYADEIVQYFQTELSERALTRGPHPIEGFEANMLIDIFPGLHAEDFDGVETGIGPGEGRYNYIDGELTWSRYGGGPMTSAAMAVSPVGYAVLLGNLSERLDMPANDRSSVKQIIDVIDIPKDVSLHLIEKSEMIKVYAPKPLGSIASPLRIWGEARGTWYFEASFGVTLVDWDGRIIAEGYASANGNWMTEEFVPFEGELEFTNPAFSDTATDHFSHRGTLILQKANPSGLPERSDTLEIPVVFE